ncbi:MAG: helix-turn-helix transcriptional regulator [Planctomycetota bacterium]
MTLGKQCGKVLAMGKKQNTITEGIRRAIRASGQSRYAIAKASGVSEAALSRFMSGKRGLTTATLDRLADVLGLAVVAQRGRSRRKQKGAKS